LRRLKRRGELSPRAPHLERQFMWHALSGDHPRWVEELHPVVVVVQVWSRDPAAAPAVGGGGASHHPQRECAAAQDAALVQLHVLRLRRLGFVFALHASSVRTIPGVASGREAPAGLPAGMCA